MRNYLIGFCAVLLLTGCNPSPQDFVRPYPKLESHYDRVYFFDNTPTVSVNAEVKHGKQNVTETTVLVNGKEYVPKH